MKKLLFLFSASLLVLTSCSNNDNNSSGTTAVFPKTIKYTYPDSPTWNSTYTLVYNGNKLVSIGDASYRTDYTYDGNVIVKYIEYNILNGEDIKQEEVNYTYANNKLATATTMESFSPQYPAGALKNKIVYTNNSDGTVTEDKYAVNITTAAETKMRTTVFTLANENLVKSVNASATIDYIYDSKNSPFKNILGFNLLLYDEKIGSSIAEEEWTSLNNITKRTYFFSSTPTPAVFKTKYVYNADGYPTKATTYESDGTTVFDIVEYTY